MRQSLGRLFGEHPRQLGMTWLVHGRGAVTVGVSMIGAGMACFIHAAVPGWFTQTAGQTVARLHEQMHRRRAGAPSPQQWPDYEI